MLTTSPNSVLSLGVSAVSPSVSVGCLAGTPLGLGGITSVFEVTTTLDLMIMGSCFKTIGSALTTISVILAATSFGVPPVSFGFITKSMVSFAFMITSLDFKITSLGLVGVLTPSEGFVETQVSS